MKKPKKLLSVLFLLTFVFTFQSFGAEPVPIPEINFLSLTASYSPERFEMSRRLEEIWKNELGLNIKRTVMDYNALLDRAMGPKHDFDMLVLHWAAKDVRLDPDIFLYQFHHSSMDKPFAYNVYGYHNPEFDKLAEEQRLYYDMNKRREVVWKCQEVVYRDQPQTPFIFDNILFVYNSERWDDPNNYHLDIGMGVAGFWFHWGAEPKKKDKILKLAYNRAFAHLNPLFATRKYDLDLIRNIYDPLTRMGPDGKVGMWAAKEITRIDDTTLDVVVRDDMVFHDGKPCTAKDVKFTFDFMKKWEAIYYHSAMKVVEKVDLLSENKIRINLKHPFAPIYVTVFSQMPILPKHVWEKIEKEVEDPKRYPNEHPIGGGPFKFAYWKKGQELLVKRHEEHWNPAKPEGLLYLVYGSTDAMCGAVETGEADVTLFYIQPFQYRRLVAKEHISGEPLTNHGFFNLWYNNRNKPFDDKAFRNAIARTIPSKQFIKDIFEGFGSHEGAIIGAANKFWHNPNLPPIEFDIEEAKRILKEAGYSWNKDGELCYPPK
jgi:peptide/nickel transport system substrate-binding protein